MSHFARRLLTQWRHLHLPISDLVAVIAVSGGADSVALLLGLDELINKNKLNIEIVVAHVDHQLRKTSAEDARWVRGLSDSLGYPVAVTRVNLRNRRDNLEQAARIERYKSLALTAQKRNAALVLTGHTLDDQAETILLNLVRGSGADGLGGMEALRRMDEERLLARPLLSWARRSDTETYCRARGFDFRRDEMNEDETFARVRVRTQLLPLMQTFNPRIVEAIARTGDLLRDDADALNAAAGRLLELSVEKASRPTHLVVDLLRDAPRALRRRALRLWQAQCRGDLRRLELVHVNGLESLLTENRGARTIELPGGSTVTRRRGMLIFKGRTRRQAST